MSKSSYLLTQVKYGLLFTVYSLRFTAFLSSLRLAVAAL